MSYEIDSLLDRRRLKRRLMIWRLGAVFALAALVITLLLPESRPGGVDHVARIAIDGLIVEDRARDAALAAVARDPRAKALIVHISSPGGTVVGGESLYERLRRVADHKPVVAVLGTLATSGGYMAALGADHIITRRGTITGSIGVVLQTTDVTGLLEKLGIRAEAIKSDPLKASPSPFEEMTEEAREATRAVVLDTHRQFLDLVAARRNLPPDQARALGDGRIYTGSQAVALGLVDAIGSEAEARAWLRETHGLAPGLALRDVTIRRETGLWWGWLDRLIQKTVLSETLRLDGLVSLWHAESL